MIGEFMGAYNRARALIFLVITSAFALLFVFITLRFARGGDWIETLMLGGLSALLLWQVRRWYRRVRGSSRTKHV